MASLPVQMPVHRKDADAALRALGARVAELRRKHGGISQEALAFEAGIHVNHMSTIERGIANPSVAVLLAISGILGVTLAELVEGIEMATKKKKAPRKDEDFNEAAFRIVQNATREKPKAKKRSR